MMRTAAYLSLLAATSACSLSPDIAEQPTALADMEEPLDLRMEPNDESARLALPIGSFSGIYLTDARSTLAAKLDSPGSAEIGKVVENSPAQFGGLQAGDIVLEVEVAGGEAQTINRPSEWRKIELATKPGTEITMFVDRAGREAKTEFTLAPRVHAAARQLSEQFREEQRAGVVIRTATEVEARAAELGPGAGAVIIGLSANSPWRSAGLRFEALLVAIGDQPLTHPQQLLDAARDPARSSLALTYIRKGARQTVTANLSDRAHLMREITVPLVFSYEVNRGKTEWSFLLGIMKYRSTAAAWRFRLLWVIGFGGGDADRLIEQK